MLELTRRMTLARSSIGRIAGAYFDEEGYVDGTFNTNFLKLSVPERTKNLNLAKSVLFSSTNEQLKEYRIPDGARKPGGLWQLLNAIKKDGMKNDASLDLFYAVFLFHGRYDVPVKGSDKEWLEGSEEIYEYLILTVSPLAGEYEPGEAEFGFLYPAFKERGAALNFVNIFEKDPARVHRDLGAWMLKG